jgi:hypothetical protein
MGSPTSAEFKAMEAPAAVLVTCFKESSVCILTTG